MFYLKSKNKTQLRLRVAQDFMAETVKDNKLNK